MDDSFKKIKQLYLEHECHVISFKYLDENNVFNQIDISAKRYFSDQEYRERHNYLLAHAYNIFLDSFRSVQTITIFCSGLSNSLKELRQVIKKTNISAEKTIVSHISFWVIENIYKTDACTENIDSNLVDIYANIRSEILLLLEAIGVSVISHYRKVDNEMCIAIESDNLLELIDNLVIARFTILNCAASYNLKSKLWSPEKDNLQLSYYSIKKHSYEYLKHFSVKTEADIYSKIAEIAR